MAAALCAVTLQGASGWRRTSSKGFTGVSLQACTMLMWQPAPIDRMRGKATQMLKQLRISSDGSMTHVLCKSH